MFISGYPIYTPSPNLYIRLAGLAPVTYMPVMLPRQPDLEQRMPTITCVGIAPPPRPKVITIWHS